MKQIFNNKHKALAYVAKQIEKHAAIAQEKLDERTAYVDKWIAEYKQDWLVRIGLKKPVVFPEKKLENVTCRYVTVRTTLSGDFASYCFYVDYQEPWEQAIKRCEEWLLLEQQIKASEADSWEL